MESELTPLLEKAFRKVQARDANAAIHEAREEEGGGRTRSFEVIGPAEHGLAWLEKEFLPRFVYHLESLGIRPPGYGGLFVSFFAGEELYFLRSRDVMEFAGQALRLTADEMYARWGTKEVRHAVRPPEEPREVLALPPGDGE